MEKPILPLSLRQARFASIGLLLSGVGLACASTLAPILMIPAALLLIPTIRHRSMPFAEPQLLHGLDEIVDGKKVLASSSRVVKVLDQTNDLFSINIKALCRADNDTWFTSSVRWDMWRDRLLERKVSHVFEEKARQTLSGDHTTYISEFGEPEPA